jgi:hypothetical protein
MKKSDFPQTINGILYETKEEYDKRVQDDLEQLAQLALDMYHIQKQFDARLEREPQGFEFPAEGRMCRLCMGGGSGNMWYDKRGMRCMDCQAAFVKKIIPGYVFTDDKNKRHITETSLIVSFKADRKEIRKYIKEGVLKPRRIEHGKYPDTIVFLKKDNPNLTVFQ